MTGNGYARPEALVETEHKGKTYRGRGVSTDIIEASALAFLQVINRIALRREAGLDEPARQNPKEEPVPVA